MASAGPRPEEIAPGVYRVETGRGITEANVYLARSAADPDVARAIIRNPRA